MMPEIQINSEAIARDTLEFLQVKSETCTEGPGSLFLAGLMRREGFDVTLDPVEPGRPNVLCRIAGSGGGRSLLFNGHTDTIPIGKSAPPARDGDWIIGRGAEDMKGGLVAMVHAAAALRKAGVRLKGDLWLTGVIGHESPEGKKEGPLRLIEQLRAGDVRADAIVIVEGPFAIWAASLGSTIFDMYISSDRGPIHTIKVPYAQNPARWTGRLLEEFARLEEEYGGRPPHPLCGREQINVGIVHGGDYMNRLPTRIRISGTWRWQPGKTLADLEKQVAALCERFAAESGLAFEFEFQGSREPFETPGDHPLVDALRAAGREVTGAPPPLIGMALVGDGNLFSNGAGVPTVYLGPAHETAHSDFERVSAMRLAQCARIYAMAAMEFCGV
ncbi:MAG: M20 family metallopeptidase [Bryobacteraceae bacterium]